MEPNEVIETIYSRMHENLQKAVDGLNQREVAWRPSPEANPIGFILWHLARAEDWAFQELLQKKPQKWEAEGWGKKLGLSAIPSGGLGIGYGLTPDQLASFPIPPIASLMAYVQAVRDSTLQYARSLTPQELDRKIKHPAYGEISVGREIGLMTSHLASHAGQIEYLRGLIRGANK